MAPLDFLHFDMDTVDVDSDDDTLCLLPTGVSGRPGLARLLVAVLGGEVEQEGEDEAEQGRQGHRHHRAQPRPGAAPAPLHTQGSRTLPTSSQLFIRYFILLDNATDS